MKLHPEKLLVQVGVPEGASSNPAQVFLLTVLLSMLAM